MAGKRDKQKLRRLMGDIETMKYEGIDHQHPKFQEWKKEVRTTLKGMYGEGSPILSKFDEVGSRRREERMWEEEHDLKGKGKASFKVDLEQARAILEEALEVAHFLGEDGKGIDEAEFISTVSGGGLQEEALPVPEPTPLEVSTTVPPVAQPAKPLETPPQAPPEEARERRRKKDVRKKEIDELLHELDKEKKDLEKVHATLEEALGEITVRSEEGKIEELLQQLEEQIKNPDVEMRKVQKTMEELLRVKGKKALLQRLTQETKDTTVPWFKIRELMRGVWEIDRKLLIDLLPDLLED
jgi:vacuolar-type H+-ATPase subunit I/STV1